MENSQNLIMAYDDTSDDTSRVELLSRILIPILIPDYNRNQIYNPQLLEILIQSDYNRNQIHNST